MSKGNSGYSETMTISAAIFLRTEETPSCLPVALCDLASRPVLDYVLEAVSAFDNAPVLLLSGSQAAQVETYLRDSSPKAQALLGRGVLQKWRELLDKDNAQHVLFLDGNRPFLDKIGLDALASFHKKKDSDLTSRGSGADGFQDVASAVVGREGLQLILENCTDDRSEFVCSSADLVSIVLNSSKDVLKREARIFFQQCEPRESLVVSNRKSLAEAEELMQGRLRQRAMQRGVCLQDPGSVFFSYDTKLGESTVIEPNVFFAPGVKVGRSVRIRAFSHLAGCRIADHASIGPHARLRPDSRIGKCARIGNFVEIKQADVGNDVKIGHLSYVGDARIGARANIGAGVVTCNYDGKRKNRTLIGEDAFVGSNVSLIAPVSIGKSAYVGAGSVITKDVKAEALALERSEQVVYRGWNRKRGKSVKRKAAGGTGRGD